jgi:hypothetical protein
MSGTVCAPACGAKASSNIAKQQPQVLAVGRILPPRVSWRRKAKNIAGLSPRGVGFITR